MFKYNKDSHTPISKSQPVDSNWQAILKIMLDTHEEFLPKNPADHEQSELYMYMAKRIEKQFLQPISNVEELPIILIDEVLLILNENYNACKNLTDEDKVRSAQETVNETYEDLISIFNHKRNTFGMIPAKTDSNPMAFYSPSDKNVSRVSNVDDKIQKAIENLENLSNRYEVYW